MRRLLWPILCVAAIGFVAGGAFTGDGDRNGNSSRDGRYRGFDMALVAGIYGFNARGFVAVGDAAGGAGGTQVE